MTKEERKEYNKKHSQEYRKRPEFIEKQKLNAESRKKYHEKYYPEYKKRPEVIAKLKEQRKSKWQKTKSDPELKKVYLSRVKEWRGTQSGMYTALKNRKRNDFCLSKEDFFSWYEKQPKECSYCSLTIEEINLLPFPFNRKNGLVKLSIDRMDNNVGYVLDNMCLCCFTCNTIKGNFLNFEEMKKIGRDILVPKLKKLLTQE